MALENEYADYSVDELKKKAERFKKLQKIMMIGAVVVALLIAGVAFTRGAEQGYKMIPLVLIAGIVYPLLGYGGIRKKIQAELEERAAKNA